MRYVFSQEYLLHAGSEVGGGGSAGSSKVRRSSTPISSSAIGRSQGSSPGVCFGEIVKTSSALRVEMLIPVDT